MATMLILRSRAEQLHRLGLSSHRAFRVLRREFPNAERDMLVNAAGLPGAHSGVNPWWTTWGRSLRPTQIRFQNKGRPTVEEEPVVVRTVGEEPKDKKSRAALKLERLLAYATEAAEEVDRMVSGAPTVTVPARQVLDGDWIEGHGEVLAVAVLSKKKELYVTFVSGDVKLFPFEEQIDVRLEDEGSEKVVDS